MYGRAVGRAGHRPLDRPRGVLRLPRAERRRQDHLHPARARADPAHLGRGVGDGPRPRRATGWGRSPRWATCPGELGLYAGLTGRRTLEALGRLHPRPPALRDRLLDLLDLDAADLRRRVREYSRGMKQKLGLVAALQHDPPLAILDEPTSGLDPVIQGRLLEWLAGPRARRAHGVLLQPRPGRGRGAVRPGGHGPRRPAAGGRARSATWRARSRGGWRCASRGRWTRRATPCAGVGPPEVDGPPAPLLALGRPGAAAGRAGGAAGGGRHHRAGRASRTPSATSTRTAAAA